MKLLVTGGAGFIGSNFIFYMREKYPERQIICLDKLTYAGNLSTLASVMDEPNFKFVRGDVADRTLVDLVFEEEKPNIVVNFAAESHVDRSIENPGVFLQTNISSLLNRLRCTLPVPIRHLKHPPTCCAAHISGRITCPSPSAGAPIITGRTSFRRS